MFQIQHAEWLAPKVRRILVQAPRIAIRHQPGHFVIIRTGEGGERIPLTIAAADPERGLITLIVQAIGATTEALCELETGQFIRDLAGPLGRPTELGHFGTVVLVGGGVGTAVIYPQAAALKALGNRVFAVIGGRSKPFVILERELSLVCDEVFPCTDDGSHGFHGFVTARLSQLIADLEEPAACVLTAGPVPMMKAIAEVTRPHGIRTIASLNPIMVDGTGMCGGCRVTIGGKQLFACVDGPEFDAHQVDFNELTGRLGSYRREEQAALERRREGKHRCRLQTKEEELLAAEERE